jgi:hypothetical protein
MRASHPISPVMRSDASSTLTRPKRRRVRVDAIWSRREVISNAKPVRGAIAGEDLNQQAMTAINVNQF